MASRPIDCIIFDIGNVLFPFDYERAGRRLAANSAVNREAVAAAQAELESGKIPRAAFLSRVRPEFSFDGTDDEFLRIWEQIFDRNLPMEELVERLAGHYPLYLLSNISCIHREFLHREFDVLRHFQAGVYSYEVGLLKPDPAIFELTSKRFAPDPSRALYIDDIAANVAAASAAGFQTVHYDHRDHSAAQALIEEIAGATGR